MSFFLIFFIKQLQNSSLNTYFENTILFTCNTYDVVFVLIKFLIK